MALLDKNFYWTHIVSAKEPLEAFKIMVEELNLWNDYNSAEGFVPKRYQLLSSPNDPLNDDEVARYVESISHKKIRNNYVVCLFLKGDRFIFYRKK